MTSPKKLFLSFALMILAGCAGHGHSHSHGDGHNHSHSHEHEDAPHHGIVAPFRSDQNQSGFVELKLHDDKGDLELWLTKDKEGLEPFDLPLDSVIDVSFPRLGPKFVKLKIRNANKNEDEDGQGNIRGKKTNYFIFPGNSKADASFLVGKNFSTRVRVSFTLNGVSHTTLPFELRPHTH